MASTRVMTIQHIVKTPGECGGNARVEGTRLTVHSIVGQLKSGASIEDLLQGYAHVPLTQAQIHAALAYYYDHQDEINALLAQEGKLFEQVKQEATEMRAALAEGVKFVTAREAAARLGMSPQSNQIARLCRDGKLNGKKVANRWFVSLHSLESYAAQDRKPGPK